MTMPPSRRTAIILGEREAGNFYIDIRLTHNPAEESAVPSLDILTMAVAHLVVTADPVIDEAIARIHEAYNEFRQNPDHVSACRNFNDTVGMQIYDVEQQNEKDAS
jgi:hypothetical protein